MKKQFRFILLLAVLLLSLSATSVFAASNSAPSYNAATILAMQNGRQISILAVNQAPFDMYACITLGKPNIAYSTYWSIEYGGKAVGKSETSAVQAGSNIEAQFSVNYNFPKAGNYIVKYWLKRANTNDNWTVAASRTFKVK